MKNIEKYKQTKFHTYNGKISPTNDTRYLLGGSWLNAKYISNMYQKYIPQYAKGKLLDLGCGYVPLYDLYRPYIEDNICADWVNTLHKNEYLDVTCDLNEKLPFDDNSFDTIILSDVIEHIKNPVFLFAECSRILKNGGYLLVNAPFFLLDS